MALVGLYMIVKYVGQVWLNWLLGWYFAIAGVGSVWNVSVIYIIFVLLKCKAILVVCFVGEIPFGGNSVEKV